jgi:hypothetical protein
VLNKTRKPIRQAGSLLWRQSESLASTLCVKCTFASVSSNHATRHGKWSFQSCTRCLCQWRFTRRRHNRLLPRNRLPRTWVPQFFLPIFFIYAACGLANNRTSKSKEPNASPSQINPSVIGHWSLTQLGHKKHVANLAKLTNLANLKSSHSEVTYLSYKRVTRLTFRGPVFLIDNGCEPRNLACALFTH